MTCPECNGERVTFRVPTDLREYAPGESAVAQICTRCLRVTPSDAAAVDEPAAFQSIHPAFPSSDAGAAFALLLNALEALAVNRSAVSTLIERVETAGGDPFLALDRLADASTLDPYFDLHRRRKQLDGFV